MHLPVVFFFQIFAVKIYELSHSIWMMGFIYDDGCTSLCKTLIFVVIFPLFCFFDVRRQKKKMHNLQSEEWNPLVLLCELCFT